MRRRGRPSQGKRKEDTRASFANAVDAQFRSCECEPYYKPTRTPNFTVLPPGEEHPRYIERQPSAPPEDDNEGEYLVDPSAPPSEQDELTYIELEPSAPPIEEDDALAPPVIATRRTVLLDPDPELKDLLKQAASNRIRSDDRWLLFDQLGTDSSTIVPRLLLLWIIGLPLLLARIFVGGLFMFFTLGLPSMVIIGTTTAGSVVFQSVYRDTMLWAKHDNSLQHIWDVTATVLTLILSIFVYNFVRWIWIYSNF